MKNSINRSERMNYAHLETKVIPMTLVKDGVVVDNIVNTGERRL
jgi:hypothetical protein